MIATSAAPPRSASAQAEGTVNHSSYFPSSGPLVKPHTSGAVFRYCTTETRSLLKNPLSTVPQLYQTRFCSRPPPFVVKRSFPSEAPNMLKLTYVTTPNRVPHSLRFLQRVRVFLAVLFCL